MTRAEMLTALQTMTGEITSSVLQTYLDIAGERVVRKCYPFNPEMTEVPTKYQYVQLEAAVYLLNKRGAEGQTYHSENGINRTYEAASIPDSIMKSVVPYCGVV